MPENWVDVGAAAELGATPLRRISVQNREIALSFRNKTFGAVANACNHVGGPLGDGRLDGEYITCPWHNWKFHRCSGLGEPGFEEDRVPAYPIKVENGRVFVDVSAPTRRMKKRHAPHPLARKGARRGPCASPASRPRPWMPPIRAFQRRTTCWGMRSPPAAISERRRA